LNKPQGSHNEKNCEWKRKLTADQCPFCPIHLGDCTCDNTRLHLIALRWILENKSKAPTIDEAVIRYGLQYPRNEGPRVTHESLEMWIPPMLANATTFLVALHPEYASIVESRNNLPENLLPKASLEEFPTFFRALNFLFTTIQAGLVLTAASKVAAVVGVGVATTLVAPVVIGGVLSVLGFGASGVVAGSIAAGAQSAFYGGATTGVFSVLQSVGAVGLSSTASAVAGTVAGSRLFRHLFRERENPQNR